MREKDGDRLRNLLKRRPAGGRGGFRAEAGLGSEVGNLDVFSRKVASVQITWKSQKSLIYCVHLITTRRCDDPILSFIAQNVHARTRTERQTDPLPHTYTFVFSSLNSCPFTVRVLRLALPLPLLRQDNSRGEKHTWTDK